MGGPGAGGAEPVEELARAKINLDLQVTGRRADGYHELDSLTAFAAFGDRLILQQHDRLELEVIGPFAGPLAAEPDNLVLRAARRLASRAGREATVRITLDKRLPVAAGLGGGSADAAAVLRGLNRLWRLGMAPADLAAIAVDLGADVPVCLAGRAARMRGIGDRLEPWDELPPLAVLLVNPDLPLSTAAVFGALQLAEGSSRARLAATVRARRLPEVAGRAEEPSGGAGPTHPAANLRRAGLAGGAGQLRGGADVGQWCYLFRPVRACRRTRCRGRRDRSRPSRLVARGEHARRLSGIDP